MQLAAQITGKRTPCEKCPLRPKPVFRKFTAEELAFVSQFKTAEMHAKSGANLLIQGERCNHLFTVLSGWVFRYKTLADGRRQVINFALPGDLMGLQSTIFEEMQHSAQALTDVVLCVFPREKLWTLFETQPGLGFDIAWLAAREELIIDEHLLSLGRRSALERTAYLLLHLYQRAEDVGLAKNNVVQFPFTQQLIADALGLSLVHTNKTLRRLFNSQTVRWRDRVFEILDRKAFAAIAGYDDADRRPRPLI